MKAFFYKSKLLILIYSTSAFLLTLSSAAIIKHFYSHQKPLSCLTDNYMVGIVKSYDIESEKNLKNKNLLAYLNYIKEDFIYIQKISNTQGQAILHSGRPDFELPLISGRLFTEEDFAKHTDTIIISNKLEKDCINRNNKTYYIHGNDYFEVIGIFKGLVGSDMQEPLYYINLQAESLQDNYAYGEYLLDAAHHTQYINKGMEKYLLELNNNLIIKSEFAINNNSKKLTNIISNARQMISMLLISGALVLANSLSASSQWINGRKKEIAIRKLLGASDHTTNIWLIKQYSALICCSFFIGSLLAASIIKFSNKITAIPTIYLLFGHVLNIKITVIAFIILFIEGLTILFITLSSYTRKHIVNNVR